MSIRSRFRRVIGDGLSSLGFEVLTKKSMAVRRFEPYTEQRVELLSDRTHAGGKVLGLMLSTSVQAFGGSPGLYGPGLHWHFTMNAIVANPLIACELELPVMGAEQHLEEWLRSMSRDVQRSGLEFFARTRSLDALLEFAGSDFCRSRASSFNEVYAKIQRAMLYKLTGRLADSEREIELARNACPSRSRKDFAQFVEYVRDCEA